MEVAIVQKIDIPIILHHIDQDMEAVFGKLATLSESDALKLTFPTVKETESQRIKLLYYQNKRGRMSRHPWDSPLIGFKFTRRENNIFITRKV